MAGEIYKFLHALITIIGLVLGFWVLFANKKSKINRNIFYGAICLVIWLNLTYVSYLIGLLSLKPEAGSMLLIWAERLSWTAISLLFIFAHRFIRFFPKNDKKFIKLDTPYMVVWGALAWLTTVPLMIKDARFIEDGSKFIEKGILIYLWALCALAAAGWLLYRLWGKNKKIFIGSALTGICGVGFLLSKLLSNTASPVSEAIGVYSIIFILGFASLELLKDKISKHIITFNIFILVLLILFSIIQIIGGYNIILGASILAISLLLGLILYQSLKQEKKYQTLLEEKISEKELEIVRSKAILDDRAKNLTNSTKNLKRRVSELERWNKLTQGRENMLDELKKKLA